MEDKTLSLLVDTFSLFIENMSLLVGILLNYDGGDFCAGLMFGMKGT